MPHSRLGRALVFAALLAGCSKPAPAPPVTDTMDAAVDYQADWIEEKS